ncbi:MAG TPA: FMN-binding protein [Thermodesulfobacteriota bacterium]|nr:FMN-binding protein [Thermodesulfobacteriota bacterium]
MEDFKRLLPGIAELKQLMSNGEIVCWEAYDASHQLIGYAFAKEIPEAIADIPGAEDMDRYQVFGIVDPKEYKIINLDIAIHPEMTKEPWTMDVTEPEFEKRFIGLKVEEVNLSPDGKIDAITDATLSSTWITDGIRQKVQEIIEKGKAKA